MCMIMVFIFCARWCRHSLHNSWLLPCDFYIRWFTGWRRLIRWRRAGRTSFCGIVELSFKQVGVHTRRGKPLAVIQAVHRYEHVKVLWQYQAKYSEDQTGVCENKAKDVDRVVPKGPEFGVGQTIHDEENWSGDVADHWAPEDRNAPILAGGDDNIQIAAELITLIDD